MAIADILLNLLPYIVWSTLLGFFFCLFILKLYKRFILHQHYLHKKERQTQERVLKAIIYTQEEERLRIARELHDSVGSELSVLKLNLSKHVYLHHGSSSDFSNEFETDLESLESILKSLKDICLNLYPISLKHYGFTTTFNKLALKAAAAGNFRCFFNTMDEIEDLLNEESKLVALRICQEVLHNILKYSKCGHLFINLALIKNTLQIRFVHNGLSFTNKDAQKMLSKSEGLGIKSIYNRVHFIKGRVEYFKRSNGSYVDITFPLPESL